jgi:pyruvate/2-oxoglutarate dehydrogenase complex dihydrolipoamide acyltransferase (E2) component
MAHTVILPNIGQTIEESTIEEWLVGVGETVEKGEPILTVLTDKTTFEVESTADGVLARHLVQEGDPVRTGDPVAEIET